MRRYIQIAIASVLLLLGWGCGGSGNPYNGFWTGTWTESTPAQNGTLTLNIVGNVVAGSITNATLSYSGSVTGTVDSSGNLSITCSLSSNGTQEYTSTVTGVVTALNGTMTASSLSEQRVPGSTYTMSVSLTD